MPRAARLAHALFVFLGGALAACMPVSPEVPRDRPDGSAAVPNTHNPDPIPNPYRFACHSALDLPPRMVLELPCGKPVAILTQGARTILLPDGPIRRFEEPTAANAIAIRDQVRTMPVPYPGTMDDAIEAFAMLAVRDTNPDIIATAMEYVHGAPPLLTNDGIQIAGEAQYGPIDAKGLRAEGSDFNDYLGQSWTYADGSMSRPQAKQFRSLDCSGFVRMIWGYRNGLPLAHGADLNGTGLSRRAAQMDASPFGVVIIAPGSNPQSQLNQLHTGDLLLFDADMTDGALIDHVGIFLGQDEGGHYRFISSRKSSNGPTLGDEKGASILDGVGIYARSFRSARRL